MARFIAFYLPQYYPTKENDEWWGKGFTEWTNVVKAKKCFWGHNQPHIPADLGFYDLRLAETREAQAQLAQEAGVEGFCYWHYWFGNGVTILDRVFDEVLKSGSPNFPFCLGWANESWTNTSWKKASAFVKSGTLLEQVYSDEDYVKHFYAVLPAFKDNRYITIDGKPLFYVYRPLNIPDATHFIEIWQNLAKENGLKGIHFVGMCFNTSFHSATTGKFVIPKLDEAASYYKRILDMGFDAVNARGNARAEYKISGSWYPVFKELINRLFKFHWNSRYNIKKINKHIFVPEDRWENVYPTILPNWDRSPRSGKRATVYTHSTPEAFEEVAKRAIEVVKDKAPDHQVVFIQSWNEWGEGNYMEPDQQYGKGYIKALRKVLSNLYNYGR